MKVIWALLADRQREHVFNYIAEDNIEAALHLDERFDEVADRLSQFPNLGKPGRVHGTREIQAHRNYIVIYRVNKDVVEILSVIHAAQQYPPE